MPGWRERLRLHRLELTVGHQAYKFAAAAASPLLLTSCVLWFVSCHPRTVFCLFGERQCCFANESVVLRTKVCPFLRQQEWARCEHRRAPPRAWRTHRFLQMHVDRAGYLPSSSRVSSRAPLCFFFHCCPAAVGFSRQSCRVQSCRVGRSSRRGRALGGNLFSSSKFSPLFFAACLDSRSSSRGLCGGGVVVAAGVVVA